MDLKMRIVVVRTGSVVVTFSRFLNAGTFYGTVKRILCASTTILYVIQTFCCLVSFFIWLPHSLHHQEYHHYHHCPYHHRPLHHYRRHCPSHLLFRHCRLYPQSLEFHRYQNPATVISANIPRTSLSWSSSLLMMLAAVTKKVWKVAVCWLFAKTSGFGDANGRNETSCKWLL